MHVEGLLRLPQILEWTLKASAGIEDIAKSFHQHRDFLYLGRGINYPIALEGALKLKEISYIHAEGYPAGEMKHGPIALIDENLPVVALAPRDHVFEKMLGNIQEVKARGGVRHRRHQRRRRRHPRTAEPGHRLPDHAADRAPPAHAGRLRRCRSSCSRTTSPSAAARMSISRGIWRRV